MKRIYKYPLQIAAEQTVLLPEGAQVLSVQEQHGELCLWAAVDADTAAVRALRRFRIYGTGQDVPGYGVDRYVGTAQTGNGDFAWHVFEVPWRAPDVSPRARDNDEAP